MGKNRCVCCGKEIPIGERLCYECRTSVTPPCCAGCKSLKENGSCTRSLTDCSKWMAWFRYQWKVIQKYFKGDER